MGHIPASLPLASSSTSIRSFSKRYMVWCILYVYVQVSALELFVFVCVCVAWFCQINENVTITDDIGADVVVDVDVVDVVVVLARPFTG